MKTIYVMLSIIGWAWFLVVMAFLCVHLRRVKGTVANEAAREQ